jgi:hypothetical protein
MAENGATRWSRLRARGSVWGWFLSLETKTLVTNLLKHVNYLLTMSMCQLQGPINIKTKLLKSSKTIFQDQKGTSSYLWLCLKKLGSNYRRLSNRRPVGSTNQNYPSCFHFRILWILMEQHWFYFFCSPGLVRGLRSLKHWLLQTLSVKSLNQNFKLFTKN